MPGIGAAPPAPAPQWSSGATNIQGGGMGAAQSGYAGAQANLAKSLQLNNNTTSSQMGQLGQQLNQNLGSVQQNLANRGLGNTTVSQTMNQAPVQTYNNGAAQVQNQQAMRGMQGLDQLANLQMAGGMGISQLQSPYAQTAATANTMQHMMGGAALPSDFNQQQGGQSAAQYQNLMNAGQPLSFGPGQPGGLAGSQPGGGTGAPTPWGGTLPPGGGMAPAPAAAYGAAPAYADAGNSQGTAMDPSMLAALSGIDFGGGS